MRLLLANTKRMPSLTSSSLTVVSSSSSSSTSSPFILSLCNKTTSRHLSCFSSTTMFIPKQQQQQQRYSYFKEEGIISAATKSTSIRSLSFTTCANTIFSLISTKPTYNSGVSWRRNFASSSTTDTTGNSIDPAAKAIVRATSYFYDASEPFITAIASKLVLVNETDGHVFVQEGEPVPNILFLENGTLLRTKLAIENKEDNTSDMKVLVPSENNDNDKSHSNFVIVDELSERGRITGLLQSVDTPTGTISSAYATIVAKGPCTVWKLSVSDFRTIIQSNPNFVLEVVSSLAREIRNGSKSFTKLLADATDTSSPNTIPTETNNATLTNTNERKVIKILCYDTTSWVRQGFQPAVDMYNETNLNDMGYQIVMDYTSDRLNENSAKYAAGYDGVCLFVNDSANDKVIQTLSLLNVKLIAMRCAGYDRVDTKAAVAYGVTVVRVPVYSPYAVAEFAVTLLMSLNRKITKTDARVKMANFSLDVGLMGMDIYNKNVAIMGTGNIGAILCKIMSGFSANLLVYDVKENPDVVALGAKYTTQDEIFTTSDVIFLMMPLFPSTKHTINDDVIQNKLKHGVIIVNTSRGALIDTKAALRGIQDGIIGGLGIDVYENEEDYFFQDWSAKHITDPTLIALLGETNVIMSAHQAFFTKEAINKIVSTTVTNINQYQQGIIGFKHPNNCLPKLTPPTSTPPTPPPAAVTGETN